MIKTIRLRQHITEYLREGAKTMSEIEDWVNEKYKHGTSYHVLNNVLSKSGLFIKVGKTYRANVISGKYKVAIWDLKPGV